MKFLCLFVLFTLGFSCFISFAHCGVEGEDIPEVVEADPHSSLSGPSLASESYSDDE